MGSEGLGRRNFNGTIVYMQFIDMHLCRLVQALLHAHRMTSFSTLRVHIKAVRRLLMPQRAAAL